MKDKETQRSRGGQCLSDIVYGTFKFLLRIIFPLFFKVRVRGMHHAKLDGKPLLIISNHISEWDPPFLGCFLPYQVHWMAKVELFELLGGRMNGFFRALHCIPVDREKADLAAIKESLKALKTSRPLVVFAEGGIREDETSLLGSHPQLKEGAAMMALMGKCRILPVLLNGTVQAYSLKKWLNGRRCKLEIVIGEPFYLETRDRAEATEVMKKRMLDLKPQLIQQEIT